uniref:NAD-dependent epimerase/dehydratase domain-containing protein n=1 Tax=Rhizobium etli TaxID=29449 RepID=Q9RQ96_RHIET|nr:unknown [Rhizobium etli]
MARILITGAHGFIGRHLAKSLALAGNRGDWPRAWELATASCSALGLVLLGSMARSTIPNLSLNSKSSSERVDIVIPSRGWLFSGEQQSQIPAKIFHRTVSSTVELLECCARRPQKVYWVAVSSAAVYGAGHIGQIAETARPNPFSPYGHHKHIMESLCISYSESYELKVVIGRLFSVYGEGLRKQLLWDVCSQLEVHPDQILLGGSGNELRDWTAVTDVVRALSFIHTEANLPPKVINIGTGRGTNVRTIVEGVGQAWAADINLSPEIEFRF